MRFAPPRLGQPPSPPRPRCLPLPRPEASSEVRCVADATRKLVRAAAGRCARRYAAPHVERDGADGAHWHHVQRRLALIAILAPVLPLPITRYFVLGQAEPAPMLSPARGRVKIRRVDERETAEVLRRRSGKECVPRAGWGEVELACELRGIARSGKEGQRKGAARGRDVGVRGGWTRERQRRFQFILVTFLRYIILRERRKCTHETGRVEYGSFPGVEERIV
jgi:hypothetical protein